MESTAAEIVSAGTPANNDLSSTTNYYCHICAVDVAGIVNATSQEVECGNCRSNFVEAVGQGVEQFLNPPDLQSQPTTYSRRHGRVRRTPPVDATPFAPVGRRDRSRAARNLPAFADIPRLVEVVQVEHESRGGGRTTVVHGSLPTDRAAGLNNLMNALLGSSRGLFDDEAMGPMFGGGPTGMGGMSMGGMSMGGMGIGGMGNMRSFEDLLHHIMMNDNSHAGVPPAPDMVIDSLTREVVTPDTNLQRLGECCISMEAFEPGDTAISLPCGHCYKQEPIVQWLRMHNTCPVCRLQVASVSNGHGDIEIVN